MNSFKTVAVLYVLFSFNYLFGQNHNANYVDGEIYVKVKSTFSDTLNLSGPFLAPLTGLYHIDTCYRPFTGFNVDTLDRTYRIIFSDTAKTELCIDTLRTLSIIDYVEQVPLQRTSFVPNDLNSNQWGLLKINAEQAWDISKGSSSVIIAIVDNGVLTTHQDLIANLVPGYDVADNDDNPNPPSGVSQSSGWNHGTHCAGIASAVTNNGIGIASIGFSAKIMPIKCVSDTSSTGEELTATDDGVTYAMQHGANIISMSFGSPSSSITEQILFETATNKGIVLVAAAGNNNNDTILYPAAYPGVICVGATDQNDVKASFSNYGSRIDVMAPGVSVYSTLASDTNAYGFFSGTSMACPLVAGLASLVLAVNPDFSPAQVTNQIKTTADNISSENPGFNGELGTGRIDADRALGGTPSTGINVIATEDNIKIYPNPFADKLWLNFPMATTGTVEIECLDMQGKRIGYKLTAGETTSEIELPGLTPGIYMLKITSGNETTCRKVVKMD